MAKFKILLRQIDGMVLDEAGAIKNFEHTSQVREKTSTATVREYKEAMENGAKFPPVELFTEDSKTYYVGDGYQRIEASLMLGYMEVFANVNSGGKREAILYGMKANQLHGLPLTKADKINIVYLTLTQTGDYKGVAFSKLTDTAVAEITGFPVSRVGEYREELITTGRLERKEKIDKTGKVVKAGRPKKEQPAEPTTTDEQPEEVSRIETDKNEVRIPDHLQQMFAVEIPYMEGIVKSLKKVKSDMALSFKMGDDFMEPVRQYKSQFNKDCRNLISILETEIIPDNICPYCKAKETQLESDCPICGGFGVVNDATYMQAPEVFRTTNKVATKSYWQNEEKAKKGKKNGEEASDTTEVKTNGEEASDTTEVKTNGVLPTGETVGETTTDELGF